jgi:cytochrome c oxidase assembly protein subunit 11
MEADMTETPQAPRRGARNKRLAIALATFTVGMVGLAYAAVPLYTLFCQVTGFGGATRTAIAPAPLEGKARINVVFDANVSDNLGWVFHPEQEKVSLMTGETRTVSYRLENPTSKPTVGIASFNVAPAVAGQYFNKLQCFCFTEQVMKAGESRDETVTFFIDPAIEQDPQFEGLHTITLSYTFFPDKKPVTEAGKAALAGMNKLSN